LWKKGEVVNLLEALTFLGAWNFVHPHLRVMRLKCKSRVSTALEFQLAHDRDSTKIVRMKAKNRIVSKASLKLLFRECYLKK
jgi:hypothetical protein